MHRRHGYLNSLGLGSVYPFGLADGVCILDCDVITAFGSQIVQQSAPAPDITFHSNADAQEPRHALKLCHPSEQDRAT